ncbi:hypothetical protein AHMF7605_29225 [Adhaeribacter arboris]|uniref:Uncharacterized protein n=1 Tax=Adhaeribacter arboris TaxID=2072846 RepID=A0A2T2Y8M4_9BACT|nr:hypothetical protein [Adhaeribacter arboris]PSR51853.1 hypothetical protein AHMF7605_28480 [Adhaeribacter arboris]PSR51989.1 hypothetical protein AHMF7605_29225 [Adhaeribacter arboris]
MKEVLQYYNIRWYWIPLVFTLFLLNRLALANWPILSLSPVSNQYLSKGELVLEILLKGSLMGWLLFLLPNHSPILVKEKLRRAWLAGLAIWYILFADI